MSKRFQRGSLQRQKRGGRLVWLGFWRNAAGKRQCKLLGTIAGLSKADAAIALDGLVRPVNEHQGTAPMTFGTFVRDVFFVWKRRRWKESTRLSTEDRINRLLIPPFGCLRLSAFKRDLLQDFLDERATDGKAWSVVAHLRWDLRMIFELAVNDGLLDRNPADLLFVPKSYGAERRILTFAQASALFAAFPLRERLILKLCGLVGLRRTPRYR